MATPKRGYPQSVSLVALSSSLDTIATVEVAATLLNQAQKVFQFKTKAGQALQKDEDEPWHNWARIEARLNQPQLREGADFVFGVLDELIEKNWFSHAVWGRGTGFITTHSWEFISTLPVAAFVAYELVENLVELLWIADETEAQYFITEVVHHGEGRGCLNDMCEFKPRIGTKIRTGDICPDCLTLFESRLEKRELKAIQRMLDAVRGFALGRPPKTTRKGSRSERIVGPMGIVGAMEPMLRGSLPEETKAHKSPEVDLREDVSFEKEIPEHRDFCFCASPETEPDEPATLPRVTGSSAREVDQFYPFPVAHCFRAMRVEMSGTRKFKILIQLYAVITKYMALALLATRSGSSQPDQPETKDLLRRLKFGSMGDWGKACFKLLRERVNDPAPGFMDCLADSISPADISAGEQVSKDFVRLRNETEGHGFVQSETTYENMFLSQLAPAQRLLTLMQPLANYTLCRLVQVRSHRGGNCDYDARVLHGSNPLFEVARLRSATVPESDCLLRHPRRDEHVNLWPWLTLEDCPQCLRHMVFLYDHVETSNVIFREYPNNHTKRNGELGAEILGRIGQ